MLVSGPNRVETSKNSFGSAGKQSRPRGVSCRGSLGENRPRYSPLDCDFLSWVLCHCHCRSGWFGILDSPCYLRPDVQSVMTLESSDEFAFVTMWVLFLRRLATSIYTGWTLGRNHVVLVKYDVVLVLTWSNAMNMIARLTAIYRLSNNLSTANIT